MAGRPSIERLRERKARHKERGRFYRVSFAAGGFAVLLLGVALIPLPGPGWLIVAVGLFMLALEFDRAERLLEEVLMQLDQLSERAGAAGPVQKALGGALVVVGALAGIGAFLIWDVPLLPG